MCALHSPQTTKFIIPIAANKKSLMCPKSADHLRLSLLHFFGHLLRTAAGAEWERISYCLQRSAQKRLRMQKGMGNGQKPQKEMRSSPKRHCVRVKVSIFIFKKFLIVRLSLYYFPRGRSSQNDNWTSSFCWPSPLVSFSRLSFLFRNVRPLPWPMAKVAFCSPFPTPLLPGVIFQRMRFPSVARPSKPVITDG